MILFRILFSVYFWVWFSLVSLVFICLATVAWLATAWWDPRRRLTNRISWLWARAYLFCNPVWWRVKICGREKIDPARTTLYVANHLSTFDLFVLFLLHIQMQWVSKRTNVRVPVLGLNMIYARTIFLDRESPKEILHMVKESVKRLEGGISMIIFPEGERSLSGRLQPFLGGAFSIAKRARVPVQPIAITGTFETLRRYSALVNPCSPLSVTVLDAIPVEVVETLPTDELKALVWERMAAALPPDHLPLSPSPSPKS
jgi:1-acyl-sn-glycerol-3-phosphate acyltransferase